MKRVMLSLIGLAVLGGLVFSPPINAKEWKCGNPHVFMTSAEEITQGKKLTFGITCQSENGVVAVVTTDTFEAKTSEGAHFKSIKGVPTPTDEPALAPKPLGRDR